MRNIVIVKKPSLFRKGMVGILTSNFPDLIVSTYDPCEQQEMINIESMGDLLIIDINIEIDYLKVIELYKEHHKKVIIWTSILEDKRLLDLFQMKLDGYFYDHMDTHEFVSATLAIIKGDCYIHPAFSSVLLDEYVRRGTPVARPIGVLTKREWKVLELMTKGYSNKKIAKSLQISEKTVYNHVSSIRKKLNVTNRINAVLVALKQRWFVL